jgi:hypothetical protein
MGVQTQCSKAAGLLRREKPVVYTTGVSSDDIAFVIPPLNLPSVSLSVGRSTSDAVFAKHALFLPKSPSLVCNAATPSLDDDASLGIITDVDNASLAVDKVATRRSSQMLAEPANETFPLMTAAVPGKSRESYPPSSTATGRSAEHSCMATISTLNVIGQSIRNASTEVQRCSTQVQDFICSKSSHP